MRVAKDYSEISEKAMGNLGDLGSLRRMSVEELKTRQFLEIG
jgi:hypothetical protein